MKTSILVVEDDPGISDFMRNLLTARGFRATVMKSAEDGLKFLQEHSPDLVVLDINLPGMSGLRLCNILKKDPRTAALPVIILTMHGGEADRIKGLEFGADDYLAKPFSHRELLLRIEALLRRAHGTLPSSPRLQIGELSVDREKRQVFVKGKGVALRRKEYELLILFMSHPGRLMTKELITEALWKDESIVTSNTLNVHMRNLRKKLGPCKDLIETLIGEGYRLSEPME